MGEPGAFAEAMPPAAPGRRWRLAALGLAITLLVALVALASRSPGLSGGEDRANAGPVIALIHLVEIAGVALELLTLLLLVVILRFTRRRREDEDDLYEEPRQVHWAVKLLVVALPLLQLAAVVFALQRIAGQPPPLPLAPLGPPPEQGGFIAEVAGSLGLAWWEILIAVALAVAAFVAIIRVLRAPAPTVHYEPEPPGKADTLASAVMAGLRDARGEQDPRRAVIAAYASMEQMLAARGMPRRRVEAPLEYMARLFGELDISGDALRTLTDLFELARFSHHAISPATKERAIAALLVIERDLRLAR